MDTDARISELEESLGQEVQRREAVEETLGHELERRQAAEEMLEQVRAQAMELQTALDASEVELADLGVRINNEAEARAAAEIALEAETARVTELADEQEALYEELALAKREAETAKGMEQAAMRSAINVAPVAAVAAGATLKQDEDDALADLEEANERVAELSESVNALSAMGAELSAELEKRKQENKLLRAQLAALEPELLEDLPTDEAYDQEAELAALRDELSSALAQNEKLEQLLAAAQAEMEDSRLALDSAQQAAELSAADLATRVESLSADVATTTEALQQKEAELSQASARVGELETELTAATQRAETLAAQMETLRNERDALSHDKTGMAARLQDRTEEVNALTTATVTAAATIKRRDEALQRAGAQVEALRARDSRGGGGKDRGGSGPGRKRCVSCPGAVRTGVITRRTGRADGGEDSRRRRTGRSEGKCRCRAGGENGDSGRKRVGGRGSAEPTSGGACRIRARAGPTGCPNRAVGATDRLGADGDGR